MKILTIIFTLWVVTVTPLLAQVNAPNNDTALRRFLGIRSIGATIPISQPAVSGFATVLVFKKGKFVKRIGDIPILFNFGQTPIALGNPEAGYAPATVRVELLWGPRDGKMGYLFQASVGNAGVMPDFHEMLELESINTTLSVVDRDLSHIEFDGMRLLGSAYALTKSPNGQDVADVIKVADLALIVVFKEFNSTTEQEEFLQVLNNKYKSLN